MIKSTYGKHKNRGKMYIVEGNTGVGKSSFLTLITKFCPEISVIHEPLENWAGQTAGKSLLGNFYTEPKRWAYTMETMTMFSRVKEHVKEQQNTNLNRLMERSIYSGHYCFAKNGHKHGFFTPIEWNIYSQWVEFLITKHCNPPRGFIYLRAEPEVCFKRIRQRNRAGEESVSLEYMKQIHDWHEKLLISKHDVADNLKDVPVLVLDCNHDFVAYPERMREYAEQVRDFFMQTQIQLNTSSHFSTASF
jgi:deoxyadenosine/deoxycytidine kinase